MTRSKLAVALACVTTLVMTASASAAVAAETAAPAESVTVDWVEQMLAGGWTMVFLGILSLAMVAFIVERALVVRRRRFCPPGLMDQVLPLIEKQDWARAMAVAQRRPSTLSRVIAFVLTHRDNPYEKLSAVVGDIGSREIVDQEERTQPLAVIAGIAPLLGLLGTMIGMIEAFQLVSIYGDEGGASMLAGSIAKALITTATGLILAIPALISFHYFRRRIHSSAVELDTQVENLLTACFFTRSPAPTSGKANKPVPIGSSASGSGKSSATKPEAADAGRPVVMS